MILRLPPVAPPNQVRPSETHLLDFTLAFLYPDVKSSSRLSIMKVCESESMDFISGMDPIFVDGQEV